MSSGFPLQDYYSRIYKTYDLVNKLFTFGLDRKWRRQTIEACLKDNPKQILDLCCGTGDLALGIAAAAKRPVSIIGFDLNASMLEVAKNKAKRLGIQSVDFRQGDAGSMPFASREFDRITIGFGFRNLIWQNPNQERHLEEMSRVLRPGARLLILESAVPESAFVSFFYRIYLKAILVPLGGILSGDWKAYRYLAGSSSGFYDFSTLKSMMEPHKLILQSEKKYMFGSVNLLIATKKAT
jgi:demethylmenaquinone methyltransferase / 2-methoxy-6-polyprenyl-1,4-benzoquinol methylase